MEQAGTAGGYPPATPSGLSIAAPVVVAAFLVGGVMAKTVTTFDPNERPWPACVKPWPDKAGVQPRDGSWGYVERGLLKAYAERVHIHAGDTITVHTNGKISVVKKGWH